MTVFTLVAVAYLDVLRKVKQKVLSCHFIVTATFRCLFNEGSSLFDSDTEGT